MKIYLKHICILFLICIVFTPAWAQDDCVLKLNDAEKLYENGKIEQIPALISACIESGFNTENKIQALRLLTLVYLFEDNTTKAERSLLQLLKIDPEYKANQNIDPVEFIKLFNAFNTAPVFSIGLIGGPSLTKPHLIEAFSMNAFPEAKPKYTWGGLSFSLGLKGIYHIKPLWDISLEPSFSYLSFQLDEETTNTSSTTITESMKYLNFPVYASYYFYKLSNYEFFAEAGVSYDMFISGDISGIVTFKSNELPGEPTPIASSNLRPDYNLTGALGVGTKIDINRGNIQLCFRYKFGLMNVVNPDARYNQELLSEYYFVDNDFSLNNYSFSISYNREFYIHRKKPNNKTNYDIIR